jgi:hypothetical protein
MGNLASVDNPGERWLPVVGFEDLYEVSDRGQLRSLARLVHRPHRGPYMIRSRIRKTVVNHTGHVMTTLFREGDKKLVYVHRLVLEAFVGPPPVGLVGCHNNGSPTDNRVENLRWDTLKANSQDMVKHGNCHSLRKTRCPAGHEYDRVDKHGYRQCTPCRREQSARSRAKRRQVTPV